MYIRYLFSYCIQSFHRYSSVEDDEEDEVVASPKNSTEGEGSEEGVPPASAKKRKKISKISKNVDDDDDVGESSCTPAKKKRQSIGKKAKKTAINTISTDQYQDAIDKWKRKLSGNIVCKHTDMIHEYQCNLSLFIHLYFLFVNCSFLVDYCIFFDALQAFYLLEIYSLVFAGPGEDCDEFKYDEDNIVEVFHGPLYKSCFEFKNYKTIEAGNPFRVSILEIFSSFRDSFMTPTTLLYYYMYLFITGDIQ